VPIIPPWNIKRGVNQRKGRGKTQRKKRVEQGGNSKTPYKGDEKKNGEENRVQKAKFG